MKLWFRVRSILRNLFRKRQVESQLDAEVRVYVDTIADERVASGMSGTEARPTTQAESGGIEQVKQAVRDNRSGAGLQLLWQDARFGLRQLWRNPGFTLTAVAALALGIGTNTAIFTMVNAVLLKQLAYPDADRIVHFYRAFPEGPREQASIPEFRNLQQQTSIFKEIAGYDAAETCAGWHYDWHRRSLRADSTHRELPVSRQTLGPGGIPLRATPADCGCAARRVAACRARFPSGPHAGVARGVIRKRLWGVLE